MSAAERLSFYPPLLSVSYPRKYTVEEYLVLAESFNERLEYVNGFIVKKKLSALGITIHVVDIYDDVNFD